MVTKIWDFLSTEGFHPHGMCLLWRPDIFWMHVASDVIIALSYFSIPAALFYLASRRPDLIYRRVFVLFGAFIVACGITHLLSIWTLWVPDYSISALVKTITAIISLTTAIVIWPLMPKLLTLPSTQLLEQKNLELAKEIEERKLAEERLSLSNKLLIHETNRAESANQSKSQFLATMSHEIRTPMNGVLAATDILERAELTDSNREMVTVIKSSGRILLGLLNDLLDLSKIEAGQVELERRSFTISGLLKNTEALWSQLAREKGLELKIQNNAPNCDLIYGDEVRLGQVLNNFVNNAIKFTETGTIRIVVGEISNTSDQATLRFAVEDSGIGITDEQIGKLFKPFSQADSSTTRSFGGTGLGLAISKSLIELMGGTIGVEKRTSGGSVFWFQIEADRSSVAETDSEIAPKKQAPAPNRDTSKCLKVLVAEDNLMNQKLVRIMLEQENMDIHMVNDGEQAVAAVAETDFDVVLMDANMPVMNGLTATKIIRDDVQNESLPIIALTANAMQGDREKYLQVGMTDYLSKPINQRSLLDTIARALDVPPSGAKASATGKSAVNPAASGKRSGADKTDTEDCIPDIESLITKA